MSAPVADTVVPAERRRYPRKNVIDSQLLTVALPGEDAAHRRGIVLDVSEGGMAVQPFVPLTPGSTSGIELDLAGSTLFRGTGIVAWVGSGGRAGIRFIDVPPSAREQLRRFLGVDSPQIEEPELAESAQEQTETAAAPSAAPIAEIPENQELDLDGALELIAERARDITSATGVAVALGDSQSMVCRASNGMAPDLGARLQRDAGLSGYCLRTGELVHCPDTLEDPRIKPAIAAQLNVRSILIVPVFTGDTIAGLLEVLSARPHAFEPRHIVRLQRVAQLLSGAIEDNTRTEETPEAADLSEERPLETALPIEAPIAAAPEPQPVQVAMGTPVNAADVAAPALSILSEPEAPEPQLAVPVPVQTPDEPASAVADIPVAVASLEEPAQEILATEAAEVPQDKPEPAPQEPFAEQRPEASAPAVIAASAPGPELAPVPAPQTQELPEAPAEAAAPMAQVLELSPALVRRMPQHSRTRGTSTRAAKSGRVHHIGPVYLTSALGLGGEVVLGATITTEGTLDNIRVVRGPKLLGSAAVNTVSQWRCQPCQFNGGPVEVDTTITIHFAPAK